MNFILLSYFEIILLNILLFSLLLTVIQRNPVYSIIFLIFSFFIFSILLLVLGVEFIALLFLVLYAGAISILFLFVLMMLDIRYLILENKKIYFFYGVLVSFFIILIFFFSNYFETSQILYINFRYTNWIEIFNYEADIKSLGKVIYNIHYIDFCLCGLVLLVSMIGSISLVINFNLTSKYQFLDNQIKRKYGNNSISIKKSFKNSIVNI